MEVKLKMNQNWFNAVTPRGAKVKLGPGLEDGPSPMEAVLMAAGGCSGIDVVSILKKMRQPLEDLEIQVSGQRREEHPRYFHTVTLKFILTGDLDAQKVEKAIELSMEKYCSVTTGLRAEVNYEYEILGGGDN